jgi:hypothetical protein
MADVLTIITMIQPDQLSGLKDVLTTISTDAAQNDCLPLGRITLLHFARFVVIDEDTHPRLLFSCIHDASVDTFLEELATKGTPGVDALWSKCEGYPAQGTHDLAAFQRYLGDHAIPSEATFKAYVTETAQSILSAGKLRERIEEVLDAKPVQRLANYLHKRGVTPPPPSVTTDDLESAI